MAIKIDELMQKFKEFKEELNKNVNCSTVPNPTTGTSGGEGGMYRSEVAKAEAGKDPKIMHTKKPLKPKDVENVGASGFKITVPKDNKGVTTSRHPMSKMGDGDDMMAMSEEVIKFDKNGQWKMEKADKPKAKAPAAAAKAPAPDEADPTDPAAADPAAAAQAKDPADPVPAAAAPAAAPAKAAVAPPAKDAGAGSGSGNSPTKTNTETGGSSPGGASTGGVGSGLGGAGTGGAATGGASTGGAGTVTVTISGSSTTETSSGAGAKKGGKGGGKPAGPITLNISNVGGRTDAGNVASGDGPGASGSGGTAPNGFGGGGGGASPDEPKNFSTQGKDKMAKTIKFEKNGQWSLDKSAFKTLQHKIEGQGHSKDSAAAITASIGRKEIGQKEMTARSKAGMNKVDPEENVNIPHPQGKAKMANGVNKGEGKNRTADPKDNQVGDPRGHVRLVKDGTNEEANPTRPHNSGKFKVMDEVKEKESKKEDVKGKPYNGEGKLNKDELCKKCKHAPCKCGNDENKAPGRGTVGI